MDTRWQKETIYTVHDVKRHRVNLAQSVVMYYRFSSWDWLMHARLLGIEVLFCSMLLDVFQSF